ncbi:phytanoyl-CoA dioxygenase family protein [Gimesia chilikensis]|uniref:phytanoyl-CoA dioxygenase family protein n=1 Tax=Gimesia chilikensis TaxID=2605989 RepID=UPI0011EFCACD|nr:phytanoyl-CoA dioxygenase family protein [Gimesia chilikensis]KAA0139036.1 phytanoyl-CoA dioxygenase family protein [Gimesia chilikensis]
MSLIFSAEIKRDGFQIWREPLSRDTLTQFEAVIDSAGEYSYRRRRSGTRYAIRNAHLVLPGLRSLLEEGVLKELASDVLQQPVSLVSATLFDKRPGANWFVPPHQDLQVPIQGRIEDEDWKNWSVKAEQQYVEPPPEVLQQMLAVRVHLDECPGENGALEVVPRSHHRRLSEEEVALIGEQEFHLCPVDAGEVLLMNPLLVHRSRSSQLPQRRRVLHVVYCAAVLTEGLAWT